ncbi:hypothetical protein [Chitinophaga lutea]|nr:hypothetical protein [Chitinophaga lutea]
MQIAPSPGSSPLDFDFLIGRWNIRNRRLKTRLDNCTEWLEFDATDDVMKILLGTGNIGQFHTSVHNKPYAGLSLRLFNPATRLWSIYWANGDTGVLDIPVVGSFDGPIGKFYSKDELNGHPIDVEFTWDATNPEEPVWSQAFSPDGGHTWETNWYMYHRR